MSERANQDSGEVAWCSANLLLRGGIMIKKRHELLRVFWNGDRPQSDTNPWQGKQRCSRGWLPLRQSLFPSPLGRLRRSLQSAGARRPCGSLP